MLVDYLRLVHAKQTLQLQDEFEFIEFEDITGEGLTEDSPIPDELEMFAIIKIPYKGEIPESYKALNLTIGDWVEEHESTLTPIIHGKLKEYFATYYPESDWTELDNGDSAIWTDQLDYMPRVEADTKTIVVEIELVLHTEPRED